MKPFSPRLFLAAPSLTTFAILSCLGSARASSPDVPAITVPAVATIDLKTDGVLGFAQAGATVVCDTNELRLSVRNDDTYLYAQAVLWGDGDDTPGEMEDGRAIGDYSSLIFTKGASGDTAGSEPRTYSLNPRIKTPGLYYQLEYGGGASSYLTGDSKGRGAIAYVNTPSGKVRADTFVIPLDELRSKPGDTIRFAYYGVSPTPKLKVNSIGFVSKRGDYYPFNLPEKKFTAYKPDTRPSTFDITTIPDGRFAKTVAAQAPRPLPEVGKVPPEIRAKDWLNTGAPVTLAGLRGKVVLLDFWATWCGPCVASIPHVGELQKTYASKGLVVIGLTDQNKKHIGDFIKKHEAAYIHGTGSASFSEYGVTGFPHVFLIGRDGRLVWQGHWADDKSFEKNLNAALEAK